MKCFSPLGIFILMRTVLLDRTILNPKELIRKGTNFVIGKRGDTLRLYKLSIYPQVLLYSWLHNVLLTLVIHKFEKWFSILR